MSEETRSLTLNPELEAFQASLLAKYDAANRTALKGQTVFVGSSLMEIFPIEQWEESGDLTKELTFDGAHLNPAGYRVVLANLAPYL
jgi:hypothetical protein